MGKKKVLIIGGGGREHALAWRLAQSPTVGEIYAAPGNPGIANIARCLAESDYLAIAEAENVDLTVVGPEVPLVEGIVDRFRSANRSIFGPTAAAAQLEGSKAFSKAFMSRHGIATARFHTVHNLEDAWKAIDQIGFPVVLKADGLAAGKGVVIAQNRWEAEAALPALMGSKLVVEEFLRGSEISFIVLCDGKNVIALEPTQDHKAAFDGDRGPNTGGMGAYCDSSILASQATSEVIAKVIEPTVEGMRADGVPFTGFLYAGLMMTADGPKVLEFNARLGDPEAQALMHRFDSDLFEVLEAGASTNLAGSVLRWKPEPSVCVVLAAQGYPGQVRSGDRIQGIESAESKGAVVFQAGTCLQEQELVTAGGRVLGVTASGANLAGAISNAYAAVSEIHFEGMHYRRDIGAKGLN